MPTNGPLNTPFENPLMATPSASEATTRGAGITLNESGGPGLQGTPFEKPLVKSVGQEPTANSSELPSTTWTTTGGIPNDPGAGSTAAVADGVATPNTPVGNMAGGHGTANTGVGKS